MYVFPLVRRQLMGWSMPGTFPAESVAVGFTVALASALAAGLYPARKAAQLKILEALSYE
jgi:ABC-type antimicrobial peptide transport system permease subunit